MKNTENHGLYIKMQFPPENFESLRQFLILLRHGEIELDVGKKSLLALINMIESPDKVATSTIVELANFVNISPASITRLAKLLGYNGYNAFRQIFKQSASTKTNFYSQLGQGIVNQSKVSPKDLILQQLKTTDSNIQQCLKHTDEEMFSEIIKLLAIKRRVFIFGHQQSSAVASIFRYGLSLIRNNVSMLGPIEHGIAPAVGQLLKGDLLIIFSSAPYSQVTVNIASIAEKMGCQICAITDSKLSPLHDYAKTSINIPTEGHYFTNSLAANGVLVESLLSLTAIELGQAAIEKLKQHEMLLSQLNDNT